MLLGFAQSAMAMNSNIAMSPPSMVDSFGHQISSFQVGQEIGIESTLKNNGNSDQKFTYLVQVIDNGGGTDFLEGTSLDHFLPNQSFNASQVWIPKTAGQYNIEIFVWDSLTSAIPLTDVLHTTIIVT